MNLQQKNTPDTLTPEKTPYYVQPGDLLNIKVSSIDPQSVAIFNKDVGERQTNQVSPASLYINGYSVNDSGYISLPFIGDLKVMNMEVNQIKDSIEHRMQPYYKFFSVDVKLISFRVTVLGEVNSQGTYYIYNDDANIMQVIGMAGGFTDLANKKKVKIIRKENNQSKSLYVNVNELDALNLKYYYIQPNDIIYAEPLKAKTLKVNAPAVQIVLSALTFVIVFANFIIR